MLTAPNLATCSPHHWARMVFWFRFYHSLPFDLVDAVGIWRQIYRRFGWRNGVILLERFWRRLFSSRRLRRFHGIHLWVAFTSVFLRGLGLLFCLGRLLFSSFYQYCVLVLKHVRKGLEGWSIKWTGFGKSIVPNSLREHLAFGNHKNSSTVIELHSSWFRCNVRTCHGSKRCKCFLSATVKDFYSSGRVTRLTCFLNTPPRESDNLLRQ